jgi:DNA-binding transcriptional LysR family regulator
MDFRQFRYFVTAADELHFARAAERLGIAQPALSQQIKVLENQLGAKLFLRAKRRVELTETGAAFLQEARATLDQAEKAIRVAQGIARCEAGSIDIGIVGSVMFEPLFPHVLKAYRKTHPGVQLSLHEMPILEQIEGLGTRRLDIAIIREPLLPDIPQELDCFTLSSQRLVAVLPDEHPLADSESVALSALASDEFLAFLDPEGVGLGQTLLDLCHSAGFEPKITQRVADITTLVSLVAAGFGVSLVADVVSHLRLPGVCYRPLSNCDERSKLMVIQRRFERSTTVRTLLENLRTAARETDYSSAK